MTHIRNIAHKHSLDDRNVHIPERCTRAHDTQVLETTYIKYKTVERSVYDKCVKAWNALDVKIRGMKETAKFKYEQKQWLLRRVKDL